MKRLRCICGILVMLVCSPISVAAAASLDQMITKEVSQLASYGITFVDVIEGEVVSDADALASALGAAMQLGRPYAKPQLFHDLVRLTTQVELFQRGAPHSLADLDTRLFYNFNTSRSKAGPDYTALLARLPSRENNLDFWIATLLSSSSDIDHAVNVDGIAIGLDHQARVEAILRLLSDIDQEALGSGSNEKDELRYKVVQICKQVTLQKEQRKLAIGYLMAAQRCPDNKKAAIRAAYTLLCHEDAAAIAGTQSQSIIAEAFRVHEQYKVARLEEAIDRALIEKGGDIASTAAATWDRYAPVLGLPVKGSYAASMVANIQGDLERAFQAKGFFAFALARQGQRFREQLFGPLGNILRDEGGSWERIYVALLVELGILTPTKPLWSTSPAVAPPPAVQQPPADPMLDLFRAGQHVEPGQQWNGY